MKSATLGKLQCAARADAVRLVYFDEAGFAASPPVQRACGHRAACLIVSNHACIAGARCSAPSTSEPTH
jgi:hypothetical protein